MARAEARTPRVVPHERNFGVAAGASIVEGDGVCQNAAGFLVPASESANLKFVGRAEETCDNTLGANGDLRCDVTATGAFGFVSGTGGDAIDLTNVGDTVFFSDVNTVNATNNGGARSASGKVYDVANGRVFVKAEN